VVEGAIDAMGIRLKYQMKPNLRLTSIGVVAIYFFLLLIREAHANSMAPATFTFLNGPPAQVIPEIVGISLLIVMIEATFLMKMIGVRFWSAVWASFVANVVSSIFGLIILAIPFLALPIGIFLAVRCYQNRASIPAYVRTPVILALLSVPILMLVSLAQIGSNSMDSFYMFQGLISPLSFASAFGLSVYIEGDIAKKMLNNPGIWNPVFFGNIVTYILLIAVTAGSYVPAGSPRAAWASRAKGTLRSIGSTEQAYKEYSQAKVYGTFKALLESGDIARGYTKGNMIENYSLTWKVDNGSESFEVIAWPRDTRSGYLSTFAVTEDQVVRVYNPKKKNRVDTVRTWDPIL
jgi:hypothetical protein